MTQLVATAVIGLLGRERPTAMLLVPCFSLPTLSLSNKNNYYSPLVSTASGDLSERLCDAVCLRVLAPACYMSRRQSRALPLCMIMANDS
jgi:hypothetical protein